MIGYEEITTIAPAADTEERDRFFESIGVAADDLVKVGHELALARLATLEEGQQVSAQDIITLAVSMMLFGFEVSRKLHDQEIVGTPAFQDALEDARVVLVTDNAPNDTMRMAQVIALIAASSTV